MARTLNCVRGENISGVFFSDINRECIFFLILRYSEWLTSKCFIALYRSIEWDAMYKEKTRYMETVLIRTTRYYGQFALSLGKERSYIFSKLNPLLRTLSTAPSVSVLTSVWAPRCPYSRKFVSIIRQIWFSRVISFSCTEKKKVVKKGVWDHSWLFFKQRR